MPFFILTGRWFDLKGDGTDPDPDPDPDPTPTPPQTSRHALLQPEAFKK
jgi:hypothetical protein